MGRDCDLCYTRVSCYPYRIYLNLTDLNSDTEKDSEKEYAAKAFRKRSKFYQCFYRYEGLCAKCAYNIQCKYFYKGLPNRRMKAHLQKYFGTDKVTLTVIYENGPCSIEFLNWISTWEDTDWEENYREEQLIALNFLPDLSKLIYDYMGHM